MTTALRLGAWKGQPSVTLVAGERDATFLPGCGMLCASVRHRGEEFVAWPRTLAQFLEGRMTAIPFVHPWGNRLAGRSYRVGRREVDLRGLDLPTDPNGRLIHGNLRGAPFEVVRAAATATNAHLVARLDYGARPDLLAAFPFPHVVTIDARLDERGLRLTTEIEPTGRASVPVSFCWHPFVHLPGVPRREWELRWPRCERILVDDRIIPTGERVAQTAEDAPLGTRTFDDHYALGTDRRFALHARGRAVEMRFGPTYPYAQLYVPARGNFAAIEPMTAPIDALGRGDTPLVKPGETFRAWFTIAAHAVTLRLLPVGAHTGFLGALLVPDDLYWVCRTPVALAGMAYPGRADWSLLASEGIGHVVCLTHDVVPYDPSPCTVTAFKLQDLVSGGPPNAAEQEHTIVRAAASDVVAHVEEGVGVAVHCMGGRGRTGTVIGVALVRLGHEPDAVVDYLHRLAVGRGRRGWPESQWQADVIRGAGAGS